MVLEEDTQSQECFVGGLSKSHVYLSLSNPRLVSGEGVGSLHPLSLLSICRNPGGGWRGRVLESGRIEPLANASPFGKF